MPALKVARDIWHRPWLLVAALCFIAIVYTYHDGTKQDRNIQRTSATAINQFCRLAEQAHAADVKQLRDTYNYLDSLPPRAYDDPINAFVISRLPETEKKGNTDTAPRLCDEPGRGLSEPDPVVPERPLDLQAPPFPPAR